MLDNSSRKIGTADEFDAETTKNVLIVLKKTQRECKKGVFYKGCFN